MGGFPVAEFDAVLDHVALAGNAVSFIQFVSFLERVEGRVLPVWVQILLALLVSFLSFFVGGALGFFLRR